MEQAVRLYNHISSDDDFCDCIKSEIERYYFSIMAGKLQIVKLKNQVSLLWAYTPTKLYAHKKTHKYKGKHGCTYVGLIIQIQSAVITKQNNYFVIILPWYLELLKVFKNNI